MTKTKGRTVSRFIEKHLTLGGSFLGKPFIPMQWQRETIDDIYLLNPDGSRMRRAYVLGLPRKNGKSQLGSALALYHLCADDADLAPLVISAAGARDQARLVFNEARRMVEASPTLSKLLKVYRNEIISPHNEGKYKVVSSDAGLQQGLNPSMVVFDELHIFKNPDLYEALTLGSAARNEPLFLTISTAGFDMDSPLGRLYQYGLRVDGTRLNGNPHKGELSDPSFGMTWYGPMPGENFDPADESCWSRFNPAWDMLNADVIRSIYATTHESAFVRFHLNGWTSNETAWLPHGKWDGLTRRDLTISSDEQVVLGFDGAWKGDSTALIMETTQVNNDGKLKVQVMGVWEAPPNDPEWRTPAGEVQQRIIETCRDYNVAEIVCDPSRWQHMMLELEELGLPVLEFPNTPSRMVPATAQLYQAIMDSELEHDGDPTLARHLSNCVVKEDMRGARITKDYKASARHIDLAVALAMAHSRALMYRDIVIPEGGIVSLLDIDDDEDEE